MAHVEGGERVIPFSPGSTSADLLYPLALSRNLRGSDIARIVAAGLFSVSSLISACSSPQPPPGRGGGPPLNPTEIEQLKTPFIPTATATIEAPKPTPTPEKRLSQEEAVASVNQIIYLIQNPDQALVTKLDLDPVRLDEDQKRLVYGFFGKAGSETNYAPDSLYGLQALIREGKIEEAKKLLKKPLINYLTGPVSSRDIEARNDSGKWNEQQLEEHDPRELVFPWKKREIKVQAISRVKEQALIPALKLYYGL